MNISDLESIRMGEELVCIEDYSGCHPKLQTGEVYYFIICYKENNHLYLSKQPLNSNANPSLIYNTGVLKYLETKSKLRSQKINNILQ